MGAMVEDSDFITLVDDEPQAEAPDLPRWKVAVIDDDPAVHDGSRFALQDYRLHGRGLTLISARSSGEARQLFRANPDLAVAFLDVVMESERAGLDLVDFVRKELGNEVVRIILRTGQPGQAPEQRIVVDYDINDYKAKTELTAEKLFTALTAALRSYEQLRRNLALTEALQAANAELEARVEQRTAALQVANQRLEERWQRLKSANAFKNEVLGTVAHDLKNPLGVILGRAEMLGEMLHMEPVPVGSGEAQIAAITESARRLSGMVDSLVADAMADALDISVRQEPVDLAALAAEVVEANRPLAERKDQALGFAGGEEIALVADPDRLREALDNLVSNAIKYTPRGGRIRVLVSASEARARIAVEDSGPGLSPEDTDRLFARFQRLSAKPTAGESSTGLGLSIAKRIVDLHGGTILVDNDSADGGARFTIVLPREGLDDSA
jgi:signal transduction histidine kinase